MNIAKIRKKHLLVFMQLRNNARISLRELSRKSKMPISSVFDCLKGFSGEVIHKQVALLNFDKIGFHVKANLKFRVDKKDREKLKNHLMKNWNVNSLYRINNGFDFSAECIFKNINELERFLENLEDNFKIRKKEICYILDDLKRETFFSQPELIDVIRDTKNNSEAEQSASSKQEVK